MIKDVNNCVSIDDICHELQVSSAAVRNWIKIGELTLNSYGFIDKQDFYEFKKNIIGQYKLNKRANKLHKSIETNYLSKYQLIQDLDAEILDPEIAGEKYQALLTDIEKNKQGIYYTPNKIVIDMMDNIKNIRQKTFCDPCCGSGNILVQALKLGFSPEYIYGFDIDPIAVAVAQARFKKLTGLDGKKQIFCLDFLSYIQDNSNVRYDFIYTNPPWGKKLNKINKEHLARQFFLPTLLVNDTCSLFFIVCLRHLTSQGSLGFLMPDAVFNIGVYESLRNIILNNPVLRFCDYGKPFKGLQTGAVFIEINKSYQGSTITCHHANDTLVREKSSFLNNPKKIINIHCSSDEVETINHIYSLPHTLLDKNIEWGIGIVTGNNTKHIKKQKAENLLPVYKGSDISPNQLKNPTNFIDSDLSLYQQVAPIRLYQSREKLIYRFISSKLIFYYDNNQCYVLNSANMLIPTEGFNYSLKLLSDILNSDFMNWLFKKIFNTHKVLRNDLERLPIHFNLVENDIFNEEDYIKNLGLERTDNGTYRIKK